jgi:hypothetical protein
MSTRESALRDASTTARKTAKSSRRVDDLKKQQEETKEAKACLKLNKLMKDV